MQSVNARFRPCPFLASRNFAGVGRGRQLTYLPSDMQLYVPQLHGDMRGGSGIEALG